MAPLVQDTKFAFRQLARSPLLTGFTVLILALGIGANTAIFSLVNVVFFQPLPYENGDELAVLWQEMPSSDLKEPLFSPLEYYDYREQSQTFEALAEYHSMAFTLVDKEPRRVSTGVVSASYFDVLGIQPILGRSFRSEDEKHGAEPVLILSHSFWQSEFGGERDIVGRTLEMNDRIHTVIGILPPILAYPDYNDVYMPPSACPFRSDPNVENDRKQRMVTVFGRLDSGSTYEEAVGDVGMIAERLADEYPESYSENERYKTRLAPLEDELVGKAGSTFLLLFATVILILLLACANLANLTFARLVRREKELAVRTAMGASRGRLLRLLLTESILLSLFGGVLGFLIAFVGLDLLKDFAGRFTMLAAEVTIDGTVLLFTLLVSLATGVIFGLMPAFHSSGNMATALRTAGGRATSGLGMKRLRGALIVVELAISFVLLVGAGLMVRSFWKIREVDVGYDASRVLITDLQLNWNDYTNRTERGAFFKALLDKVKAIPGAVSAGWGMTVPLDSANYLYRSFEIEGDQLAEGQARPATDIQIASPDYFNTIGIPLLRGRFFTESDDAEAPPAAVLSQSLVERYWGDRDPIGMRFTTNQGKSWFTVVGIVADSNLRSLFDGSTDVVYLNYRQFPQVQLSLFVKAAADPMDLVRPIREAVYSLNPKQPASNLRLFNSQREKAEASPRLTTTLLSLFAGVALLIATVGLGSMIASAVSQRTREIGVRMALGAQRSDVLRMVLRAVLVLLGSGLAIGLVGSLYMARWISKLLFKIDAGDVVTFVAVAVILAVVSLVAGFLPARRATLINPVEVLRFD